MTFIELCKQLSLSPESYQPSGLRDMKQWVHEHVSQDVNFQGGEEQQWQQYMQLLKFYLDDFVPQKSTDLSASISSFGHASTLMVAAERGLDRVIESLKPNEEEINQQNDFGITPLHVATYMGHIHTVECLLKLKANPELSDHDKMTALQTALVIAPGFDSQLKERRKKIFELLFPLTKGAVELEDLSGNTLLHLSVENGFNEITTLLVENYPLLVGQANHHGLFPIHTALLNNQLTAARILIPIDDVVLQQDEKQRNALHYAAIDNLYELIDDIAKYLPNLNLVDERGKTALLLAVEFYHPESVKKLIALGADVNLADIYQMTALHWAVKNGSAALVKLLIEHSRLELKDSYGKVALDYLNQDVAGASEILSLFK